MNHASSCSMIAVNSLCITTSYFPFRCVSHSDTQVTSLVLRGINARVHRAAYDITMLMRTALRGLRCNGLLGTDYA
jgi:hypothetical protein